MVRLIYPMRILGGPGVHGRKGPIIYNKIPRPKNVQKLLLAVRNRNELRPESFFFTTLPFSGPLFRDWSIRGSGRTGGGLKP